MSQRIGELSGSSSDRASPEPTSRLIETGIHIIKRQVQTLPKKPGVYRMLDAKGGVLYVGKAINLKKRVVSYTKPERISQRILRMVSETRDMEVVTTHTEVEALLLESNLIKRLKPRYNVLLRDDKSFAHIFISSDQKWPILVKHRGTQSRSGDYFGPFSSAGAVNRSLAALQRAFLLRSCSESIFNNRTRPCLQYQIKRCSAPCVDYINPSEYKDLVQQARLFLSGNSVKVQKTLSKRMQEASDDLDFERAAIYRDRIHALSQLQSKQDINVKGLRDADVIGIHTENGSSCIQVFFFRGGSHLGNRAYFPRHHRSDEADAILEAFIGQFYENKRAPKLLLLSHQLHRSKLLSQALSLSSKTKVELVAPIKGARRILIEHALKNAQEALERNLAMHSSTKRLMERAADVFSLNNPPSRIEVFDNSHIQGTNAVGAMVVAGPDGFERTSYRKFNIKDVYLPNSLVSSKDLDTENEPLTKNAGDDYFMMRQVLYRRYSKIVSATSDNQPVPVPDLVLIDGGAGHLSVAMEVAKTLELRDIPFVAISKGPQRNAGRETFHQEGRAAFTLKETDPLLYYLQRLRDEAHRFAIETHRARRAKSLTRSLLDDIPAVGPKRKKILLHHFGSARAIARAGLRDLENVDGISKNMACRIYDYFQEK